MPNAAITSDKIEKVAMVSLGCPKNLVDSEKMLGLLAEDGLSLTAEQEADAVIINTCGFLEASKEESLGEIRQALARKEAGEVQRVIVAGCLVQRYRAKLLEWCPGIDALIGVFDRDHITQAVRGSREAMRDGHDRETLMELPVYSSIAANATVARQARQMDEQAQGYFESDSARFRLTPRHYAYLRISEGCNQNCAFCTIPSIRGKMRSKPVERIVAEASELIQDGAFELSLIGQDTTSYGNDIGYEPGLSGMLRALDRAVTEQVGVGGAWLRLMYAYPSCFTDEMIDTLAELPNVLKYIDMPLQHINDEVLDNMRRHTSRKLIETLLTKLRQRMPDMAVRTTFITGFPGETEEQHQELVEFIRDFGFEAVGVFRYSPEPGTPAGRLHEQGQAVPAEVMDRRYEELMLAQQEVVFERNEQLVGQQMDVLIDDEAELELEGEGITEETRFYVGRTKRQAPQIDSVTYVVTDKPLAKGEKIAGQIDGYLDYDLVSLPVEHKGHTLPVLK